MRYKKARARIEVEKAASKAINAKEDPEAHAELVATTLAELSQHRILIEQWDLDRIECDMTWCGRAGSPTKVGKVRSIVMQSSERQEVPATREGIRDLVHELIVEHTIV